MARMGSMFRNSSLRMRSSLSPAVCQVRTHFLPSSICSGDQLESADGRFDIGHYDIRTSNAVPTAPL